MKQIRKYIENPLLSGSIVMIIGTNMINGINYLYHLIMGRMLGPANYGELVALLTLMGLLGMLPGSLSLAITKYTASADSKAKITSFIQWLNRIGSVSGIIIFLLVLIFSNVMTSFLNLDNFLFVILIGSLFLFYVQSSFNRSVLPGLLRFGPMVISNFVETFGKLVLGISFVYLGFSVGGAILGLFISALIGWLLAKYFISDYTQHLSEQKHDYRSMLTYTLPIMIESIAITSLYSFDLILVKHFFSSHDVGIYAAVSMLGKIILFAAGPIAVVMFPIVSQRQAKGASYIQVFAYSFVLTLLICILILMIYWLFPNFSVTALYGSLYLEATGILLRYAFFMTIFTLSSLMVRFYLSVGKTKIVVLPLLAAILQILGIWFYHTNLDQVVNVSIFVATLLLICLLVYFGYETKISFSNSSRLQAGKDHSS